MLSAALTTPRAGPFGWDHIGARATVAAIDPQERTLALDPSTGDEFVTFPEGSDSDEFLGAAHADPHGSVTAFDTDRMETTFHRVDASGEITDTAVLTETHLDVHIGSDRIVLQDDRQMTAGSGDPILVPTAGAVVLLSGDERSQVLEGLVP